MPFSPEEAEAVVQLQQRLYHDPATRADYLRLVKKVAPKTVIPEIDVPEQALAHIKPQLEEVGKLRTEFEADKRARAIEDEWRKHNVSAAERTAVEQLMTERLIGDVGTAVEYHRSRQAQAAAAPQSGSSTISMPVGDGYKGLFENPTRWGREAAHTAVRELQSART